MRHHGTLLVMVVVTLVLVAGDASALRPHVREGWHVGVSYGPAVGDLLVETGDELQFEDGVSPHMRAARLLNPHLGIGLAYAGWMYETGALPIKQRYSMQNLLLAASWYPGRPDGASGGLCLRVGVGYGWIGYTEVEIVEDEEQSHGDRTNWSGPALELNLSYEFRITAAVAAGLGLGVNSIGLDDEIESATFASLTANLGWYWD